MAQTTPAKKLTNESGKKSRAAMNRRDKRKTSKDLRKPVRAWTVLTPMRFRGLLEAKCTLSAREARAKVARVEGGSEGHKCP